MNEMKPELQKHLTEKYRVFFEHLGDKPMISDPSELPILLEQEEIVHPMQFGIECKDGWYFILRNLLECIHNYCKYNKKEYPNITQIKEKYGVLNVYIHGADDFITGMVRFAEYLSSRTCEECGTTENVGKTTGGWIFTYCEKCFNENSKSTYGLKWVKNGY